MAKRLLPGERVRMRRRKEDPYGATSLSHQPGVVLENTLGNVKVEMMERRKTNGGRWDQGCPFREIRVEFWFPAGRLNRATWTEEEEYRWCLSRLA